MLVRLQKYMADCGVGSRRKCEEWIADGQVSVNGQRVTELGTKVDPETDLVSFRGKVLRRQSKKVVIMLHKPAGYVTTSRDQFGRPSVCDLVKVPGLRLYPVGRLDYQTTGLVLLTNDGELDHDLTHPSHHLPRVYEATLHGVLDEEALHALCHGVKLDDGYITRPAIVKMISQKEQSCKAEFTLFEGKNHQVRRMAKAVGHPVLNLRRVAFGPISLGSLQEGHWRYLSEDEIGSLRRTDGLKHSTIA